MIKPKPWSGDDLTGTWLVTRKLDGVRAIITDGVALSRNNKPLYNLGNIPDGDYEIYLGDWESSVSAVRTHVGEPVSVDDAYSLDPVDPRLDVGYLLNPSADHILFLLDNARKAGDEGLVLRQGDRWLKVKPTFTYDLTIVDVKEGTGKHVGKLGAFITNKCDVGSGLTDAQRAEYWSKWGTDIVPGTIVEVSSKMGMTPDGKVRHPVFERIRWDKDEVDD